MKTWQQIFKLVSFVAILIGLYTIVHYLHSFDPESFSVFLFQKSSLDGPCTIFEYYNFIISWQLDDLWKMMFTIETLVADGNVVIFILF